MKRIDTRRIRAIARAEFLVTVARKGYLLAVLGLPALLIAAGGISVAANRAQMQTADVAVVDGIHVLDSSGSAQDLVERLRGSSGELQSLREGGSVRFLPYGTLASALDSLKAGRIKAVYAIDDSYLSSRKVTVFTAKKGLFLELAAPGEGLFAAVLRASLVKKIASGVDAARLVEPMNLEEVQLTASGALVPTHGVFDKVAGLLLSFGIFLLFGLSIFLSSNYLLHSTAEEKENRVIEAILSSVRPIELLLGKLLGLGAAGFLQVLVYVGVFFIPAIILVKTLDITIARLLLSLLFFVLGFLLFAGLMAAVGMIASSVREGTQMATIWTITSVLPLILFQPISQSPGALWVKALTFFPLTAPLTMLVRLSSGTPPAWEIATCVVALVLGIVVTIWGGAKVFRTASLLNGQRITVGQVVRWLRQS